MRPFGLLLIQAYLTYCRIEILELQTQQTFDQNKDGTVSEEEAKFFLDSRDELNWEDFLASGWSQMKPFLMLDKGLFTPPSSEVPLDSAVERDTVAQVRNLLFCRTRELNKL